MNITSFYRLILNFSNWNPKIRQQPKSVDGANMLLHLSIYMKRKGNICHTTSFHHNIFPTLMWQASHIKLLAESAF